LARHFLNLLTRTAPTTLAADGLKLLTAYDWPGNVRELRNAIERAIILARPGTQVRAEHLAFIPRAQAGETVLRFGEEPTLEQIEQEYLRLVMSRHGGNRQKTAAVLGISERNVYRLIERYRSA
jgi:transcriptional regulator with PAS, ATPase and Fis domain